jgi:hypothetical protein
VSMAYANMIVYKFSRIRIYKAAQDPVLQIERRAHLRYAGETKVRLLDIVNGMTISCHEQIRSLSMDESGAYAKSFIHLRPALG